MIFKFELGQQVKDKLTGFEGFVTGRCDYMTGCKQYLVTPKVRKGKTHEYPSGSWLDEDRLQKGKERFKMAVRVAGGPQQHPDKY